MWPGRASKGSFEFDVSTAEGTSAADTSPGRSGRSRAWLRVAGSLCLLGFAAWLVDVEAVASSLAKAQPVPLLCAVLLTVPTLAVIAWRWRFTAGRVGVSLSMRVALGEYYLSTLVNQIVPGGFGGDVARAVRVGAVRPEQRAAVVRSVVLDRLSGQAALWGTLVVFAMLWSAKLGGTLALVVLGLAVGLLFLARSLAQRAPKGRFGQALHDSLRDAREAALSRGAWAAQLGASFASLAMLSLTYALCALALGADVSFPLLVAVAPAILAVMSLPISVGGWGVREVASAAAFECLGAEPSAGVAIGALFGAVNVLGALPGLFFFGQVRGEETP